MQRQQYNKNRRSNDCMSERLWMETRKRIATNQRENQMEIYKFKQKY